ncbi:RNA polymerase sigma factor [Spirosoma fluviale]|uniref:RNA polymerase sigma factor, sigma-70 family n=1 Tax=Spirosoma fluviale TaxID=1597977 RepID=A0A286GLM1_9BACT|nr:sigma-70 family RNA polymerase sigma factor [Spirosoma fluviale]SOD96443.1 RNA polymerase sigma factor, sigma-70 family [Spirosoma fluviale]
MPQNDTNPCANFPTDERLLPALQRRVREAIACFYQRNFKKIISSLGWKGGSRQDIEDAIQNAMIEFMAGIGQRDLRAKLDTQFYQVAKNRWIDITRKHQSYDDLNEQDSLPSADNPLAHLLDSEMQQRLRKAIAQLDPRSQQLMDLLTYQHYTPEEVAAEMGVSVDSVYNQKTRCIKYLRRLLTPTQS